ATHAPLHGPGAQVLRIEGGIKTIGVGVRRADGLLVFVRNPEHIVPARDDSVGIVLDGKALAAGLTRPEPVVLEFHSTPRLAKRPERMDVAIAGAIPIAKLYPHLEGRPGRTHEMRLVDAEPVVEYLDVRQRRLT